MPNRVSVIIPAYNIATYITEAVESVLAQTYPNLEVIVINNGSEDNTAEVLQPYRDRIRYEHFVENQGIAGAYNRGLEVASGDYIAYQKPE
jgi:glycosyltransferase involved in cell wall biosynthesis